MRNRTITIMVIIAIMVVSSSGSFDTGLSQESYKVQQQIAHELDQQIATYERQLGDIDEILLFPTTNKKTSTKLQIQRNGIDARLNSAKVRRENMKHFMVEVSYETSH